MQMSDVLKVVGIIVALILVAPLVLQLLPDALTLERCRQGFEQAGFAVTDYVQVESPSLEAIAQSAMTIDGATVLVYQFDSDGKVAKQYENNQQGAGEAMVEAWGLAQSIGAAPSRNKRMAAGRNGKFLLIAHGEDQGLLRRLVQTFEGL